jgi:hypothetical protein
LKLAHALFSAAARLPRDKLAYLRSSKREMKMVWAIRLLNVDRRPLEPKHNVIFGCKLFLCLEDTSNELLLVDQILDERFDEVFPFLEVAFQFLENVFLITLRVSGTGNLQN